MNNINNLYAISPVYKLLVSLLFITICGFAPLSHADTGASSDRMIIKYRSSANAPKSITSKRTVMSKNTTLELDLTQAQQLADGSNVYLLSESLNLSELRTLAADLSQDAEIEYAEPDYLLSVNFVPNDARYAEQWNLTEDVAGLKMESVWDQYTGEGVVVAVIDSGYIEHQDLSANLLPGYDMISNLKAAGDGDGRDPVAIDMGDGATDQDHTWHGTHIAGIIAAVANNGKGVAGIAFGAKILPVRAMGLDGGYLSDISDSIIWAAGGFVPGVPTNQNPAQVINLSLGGEGECGQTIQKAIDAAVEMGATVVISAGNDQQNVTKFVPASCNNIITVGAVNRSGARAYYSNYGQQVEISAAGGEVISSYADGILSTWKGNGNAFYEGTSMAAPQVAAVAALLYQANPDITPAEVMTVLTESARPFTGECHQCGAGIIDPAAALARLKEQQSVTVVADEALQNGISADMFAMKKDTHRYFTLSVPAGATELGFEMRADNGDADMYVAYGQRPTVDDYDCRSIQSGSLEDCSPAVIEAGTYYVMVVAAEKFTGAVLLGHYELAAVSTATANNSAVAPIVKSNSGSGGGGSMGWTLLLMPMLMMIRRQSVKQIIRRK